jgi:dihydrodipicolinate synthase
VLNYLGFAAGPTRLPLVPAPEEDAKRIIKVVVDGDYQATKETVKGVLRPDY